MENRTLEKILKQRNSQLTLWLMAPVAVSYFILQGVLFSIDMAEAKSIVAQWREDQKERISQSLFLQNEADLKELVGTLKSANEKSGANFKVAIFDSRNKLKATNEETEGELKRADCPIGMTIDFKKGEINDKTPLYLGGKLQGYLMIHSIYDWSDFKRESLILLLACVGVFSILKLGVWLLVLTLRRSVVKPLKMMTAEISPQLNNFENLKPLPVDVSEFKNAPEEFVDLVLGYNHLIENIQELRKKENSFIAGSTRVEIATQLAHDIRSPLAALSLAVEDLPPLPGKQKEIFLGVMKRMQEIGEELLNSRENRSSDSPIEKKINETEPVSVKQVVLAIIEEKKLLLAERPDINLGVRDIPDLWVKAREIDLKRALSNLIDNAVEAISSQGEVTVKVSEAAGTVYLSVKDNGRGIHKDDFKRIWQPGVSVGKPHGHGLGLSFVKGVVESWGGRAVLDSAPGKGTVVSLQLQKVPVDFSHHQK
jgi:signal transduction histidine kinase